MLEMFAGFFASIDPNNFDSATDIINAALAKWPGSRGRVVYAPFIGLAIGCHIYCQRLNEETEEELGVFLDLAGSLEKELPLWSQLM